MSFQNPLRYQDKNNKPHECDGNCGFCPERDFCGFSKIQALRYSRNSESGYQLELKLGDAIRAGLRTQRSHGKKSDYSNGFSNPNLSYDSLKSHSVGFHGSYDGSDSYSGKDGYSGRTPGSGSGNSYCSGCSNSKNSGSYGGKK